jgi:O-antigen ligase
MTRAAVSPASSLRSQWARVAEGIRLKDPGLLAVKRSVRAAIVMPIAFGLAHLTYPNPQISLFAAFGSFALLLLVDFAGRPRTRLLSYLSLFFVGSCFIILGTIVSTNKAAAVAAMALVGFIGDLGRKPCPCGQGGSLA